MHIINEVNTNANQSREKEGKLQYVKGRAVNDYLQPKIYTFKQYTASRLLVSAFPFCRSDIIEW